MKRDQFNPLQNKTVLITGASSGIGAACAKYFAAAGARLLLCARRLPALEKLAQQLKQEHGTESYAFQLDVRQPDAVNSQINTLPQQWCAIDILINNAGLARGLEPLQQGNISAWEEMIDTNIKGLLYVTRAILPSMIARNSGHIINIGSLAGHEVYPNGAVYCATKHAVHTLTCGLRMDLFGKQIRVSIIDPGMVETNFSLVRFGGDEVRAKAVYQGMQPLTPDDIADAVLYCVCCPSHVNISEIILTPTAQASATMVHKK